jgi:hypothetical protein
MQKAFPKIRDVQLAQGYPEDMYCGWKPGRQVRSSAPRCCSSTIYCGYIGYGHSVTGEASIRDGTTYAGMQSAWIVCETTVLF